jgi:hypothetical protein
LRVFGEHIDDKLIAVHQDISALMNEAKSLVRPENLELAVRLDEYLINPTLQQDVLALPLPEGSLSYVLFEETSKEMRKLEKLFQRLSEANRLELSPIELYQLVKYFEVRIKRFMRVLAPRFTVSRIPNLNKNPQIFKVIRGYWYDDDGKEQRSINKAFSNVEMEFREKFKEFYEEFGYIVTQPTFILGKSKMQVDMMVSKLETKLILELKEENCLKLFTKFHLWDMYKKIYTTKE